MSQSAVEKSLVPDSSAVMSFEQFLATEFENEHVEWVNGRVVPMAPISGEHQDIGIFLMTLIRVFVEEKELGIVQYEPFQMKTGPDLPSRAPDIMFIANAGKKRMKKNYLDGPADLVVEIISPGSRRTDRRDKFSEYQKGGVPEYWLIDPARKQVDFFVLGKSEIYKSAVLGTDGIFTSKILSGLWIKPAWFWQTPLPSVLSVMRLWRLI